MDHEVLPSVVSPMVSRFEVSSIGIQLGRLALTAADPRSPCTTEVGAETPLAEVEVPEPPNAGDAVHAALPLLRSGAADINDSYSCPDSPVSWRPAEDFLPTEPEPGSPLQVPVQD